MSRIQTTWEHLVKPNPLPTIRQNQILSRFKTSTRFLSRFYLTKNKIYRTTIPYFFFTTIFFLVLFKNFAFLNETHGKFTVLYIVPYIFFLQFFPCCYSRHSLFKMKFTVLTVLYYVLLRYRYGLDSQST